MSLENFLKTAKNNKKYFLPLGAFLAGVLLQLEILQLEHLFLLGILGTLLLTLKKLRSLEENFLNLELRVAQIKESSKEKTEGKSFLKSSLLKKISLHSFHSGRKSLSSVKTEGRELSEQRKEIKEIASSFKAQINALSIKEWQQFLNETELSSEKLSRLLRFLATSFCFTEEGKKRLISKAFKLYSEKETADKFLALADFILKITALPIVSYYALQKSLESKNYKDLESYLHHCLLYQSELGQAQRERLNFILGELRILKMKVPPSAKKKISHYKGDAEKIFYVLHNSEPYMTFGYASRARGVMTALEKEGYKVYGVTRLGFPHDRYDLKDKLPLPEDTPLEDRVGELDYLRLLSKDGKGLFEKPLDDYIFEAKEALVKLACLKKPSKIIAASNFYTAFPALLAARELGIPFVYEVRGFWEVTRYSRDPSWQDSYAHHFYETMENKIVMASDKVFTLTEAMKDLIKKRSGGEITAELVPNAVTPRKEVSSKKDKELAKKLGIKENTKVIGFIGSVVEYEGLNLLAEAACSLKEKDCQFLIVGAGAYLEELKTLTKKLGVEEKFIFTGRVPHSEVFSYYSLIDLVTLPRLSLPVCELVSPLKPFEAMAEKKLLLMSDVAAMKEFTKPGLNGFLFEKGNLESFLRQIHKILFSDERFEKTKESARDWVLQNRTWDITAKKINHLLKNL